MLFININYCLLSINIIILNTYYLYIFIPSAGLARPRWRWTDACTSSAATTELLTPATARPTALHSTGRPTARHSTCRPTVRHSPGRPTARHPRGILYRNLLQLVHLNILNKCISIDFQIQIIITIPIK